MAAPSFQKEVPVPGGVARPPEGQLLFLALGLVVGLPAEEHLPLRPGGHEGSRQDQAEGERKKARPLPEKSPHLPSFPRRGIEKRPELNSSGRIETIRGST